MSTPNTNFSPEVRTMLVRGADPYHHNDALIAAPPQ